MSKDNVIGMFSEKPLIQFLEETLAKAKLGEITHMTTVLGNEEDTGFAIIGLDTLKDATEMIGNLELVKTHLTLSLLEDNLGE